VERGLRPPFRVSSRASNPFGLTFSGLFGGWGFSVPLGSGLLVSRGGWGSRSLRGVGVLGQSLRGDRSSVSWGWSGESPTFWSLCRVGATAFAGELPAYSDLKEGVPDFRFFRESGESNDQTAAWGGRPFKTTVGINESFNPGSGEEVRVTGEERYNDASRESTLVSTFGYLYLLEDWSFSAGGAVFGINQPEVVI
jgi:hypothetical protein